MRDKQQFVLSVPAAMLTFLMVGIFPLFYTNNYINIVQSKRFFFEIVSFIVFVLTVIIIFFFGGAKYFLRDFAAKITLWHRISLMLLCSGLIISTVASDNIADSIFAPTGRMLGVTVIVMSMIAFIIISLYLRPGKWLVWTAVIVNSFMAVLIIADNWQHDLLGMKNNLVSYQYYKFTGTMGNININASYMSIVIPALMSLFLIAGELLRDVWLDIAIYISMMLMLAASICVRSDSILYCLMLAVAVLWFYTMAKGHNYARLSLINFAIAISYSCVGAAYMLNTENSYKFSDTGIFLCAGKGLLIIWLMAILSFVFAIVKSKKESFSLKPVAWICLALAVLAVLFIVVMTIAANFVSDFGETGFISRFYISDSFGNNRGYVWRRTIIMIKNEGIVSFLAGHGMNRFYVPFNMYWLEEMNTKFSVPYIDAHNEFLQMLVSMGLLGALGYFGMMAASLVNGIKNHAKNPICLVEINVICSYILQGIVNNPQVFTLPLIFVFMGIIRSNIKE